MIGVMRPRCTGILAVLVLSGLLGAGCDSAAEPEEVMPRVGRGATVSVTLLAHKTTAAIDAEFGALGIPITARYAVAVYKVVYETVDADGVGTIASGALLVPEAAPGRRPLVSYQHGTLVARNEAPSAGGAEQAIGLAFATDGYVAALPDLLGLGDSPGLHPYLHAETSADAVVDMLRATQDFTVLSGPDLSGQLFLVGYSQGGYTAMAAHRAIEAAYRGEFQVTAAAPMAGPYDLSGVMVTVFIDREPHPAPYYLPYALLAYNDVYRLYETPAAFLAPPYDTLLPPLFDGRHSGGEIDAVMPEIPLQIIAPAFLEAFETDAGHPLRQRLRENDVYDWTPEAPVRLYHCGGDRFVAPENTQVAYQRFLERGAASVLLIDPLPAADHGACAAPSLLLAKLWFDSMVE